MPQYLWNDNYTNSKTILENITYVKRVSDHGSFELSWGIKFGMG